METFHHVSSTDSTTRRKWRRNEREAIKVDGFFAFYCVHTTLVVHYVVRLLFDFDSVPIATATPRPMRLELEEEEGNNKIERMKEKNI